MEFSNNINCIFSFEHYPFDTQFCDIRFAIVNILQHSLNLTYYLKKHEALVNNFPSEYYLSDTDIFQDDKNLVCSFKMTRHISYPLFSIYLPTALMHVIAYGTLWIPVSNFQDRGTMSLTTLLVLIAFYSDVLSQLPITAYLKLLDIWFIFSIAYLSIIIFFHLITSDTSYVIVERPSVDKPKGRKMAWFSRPSNNCIIKYCRLTLGIGYIFFQSVYWGYILVKIYQRVMKLKQ